MLSQFIFNETTPAAAGTAASSQAVQSSASYLAGGIAGPLDDFAVLDVLATLNGATGGVLDVYIQVAGPDLVWRDAVHFPQLAAGAATVNYACSLTSRGQAATTDAPVVVGTGTTPALAANTVAQGLGFDRARLLFVAGSGTSAGATIRVSHHRTAPSRARDRNLKGSPMNEVYIERTAAGEVRKPGTRWRNPLDRTVTMEVRVAESQENPRWKPGQDKALRSGDEPMRFPAVDLTFRILPSAEVVLNAEWDELIQRTSCLHGCIRPMYCRNPSHANRMVVGGLGPSLIRVGSGRQLQVHPALIDQPKFAYSTAGQPRAPGGHVEQDADARLLQRARARQSGGVQ
jgi:hypothetical protein